MSDYVEKSFQKFFQERSQPLDEKYNGMYRAIVVETNDPLNMYRVRFRCPDLHDWDLPDDDCPWAVPAPSMGGWRSGGWVSPCKGDHIWIAFEKGHPYSPVWVGFSQPTRRKAYPYPSIYNISPVPVNEDGKQGKRPKDYNVAFLPKDGRPMSVGYVDRYGNMDLSSSIGYFPSEHDNPPLQPEFDAISNADFKANIEPPQVNNPDMKYMLRLTKYGNMLLLGDQGYYWKKPKKAAENNNQQSGSSNSSGSSSGQGDSGSTFPGGNQNEGENEEPVLGEFTGDFKEDEQYDLRRWKFVQKFINEGKPQSDQRKILLQTRYGSRIEMRDTGWNKSRPGEYTKEATKLVKDPTDRDERWIKLRTKGGFLFQMCDRGFDVENDKFINRHILQETGLKSEKEDKYWAGRDARWIRIVTRYGYKFVMDDCGSSRTDASKMRYPAGNGILFKGRRPAASRHDPESTAASRGYYFEMNERDQLNHMTMGSPMGQVLEFNDRYQYLMMAATLSRKYATKYKGMKENEFLLRPTMDRDPEKTSHHLKIDHENEYIRLKTRARKGVGPQGPKEGPRVNPPGVSKRSLNQGFEARDGSNGDGPWVELVDADHRGFWFSKMQGLGIWRGRKGKKLNMWIDDKRKRIVIHNENTGGRVQISASGRIEIFARNMRIQAERNIEMLAGNSIRMQANGTRLTINRAGLITNNNVRGAKFRGFFEGTAPGPGAGNPAPGGVQLQPITKPTVPETIEPSDRGQTYNGPYDVVDRDLISPLIPPSTPPQ